MLAGLVAMALGRPQDRLACGWPCRDRRADRSSAVGLYLRHRGRPIPSGECGPINWLILSPHPLHYVLGYALVGLLAIIGIVKTWKRRVIDPKLIGWLIAVPLLIYLPFNSQRRLIESWQIPLMILRGDRAGVSSCCPRGVDRGW